RIVRILIELGLLYFSLTSSATLHRPIAQMHESASSHNILLAHLLHFIGRFQPCASSGFFQIGNLPSTKSSSLTRVKKWCQQTPSSRSGGIPSRHQGNRGFRTPTS